MTSPTSIAPSILIKHGLISCLGFFALALGGIVLTREGGGISSIWPATAFALAFFLRTPRKEWPVLLFSMMVGNILARVVHGDNIIRTICISPISMTQAILFAHILRRYTFDKFDFSHHRHLIAFAGVALTLTVPFTLMAATFFNLVQNLSFLEIAKTWYLADALGLIIFTPLFFTIGWDELKSFTDKELRLKSATVVSLLIVSLLIVFAQTSYPLLFVIFPVMALSAFWLGTSGAIMAITITTVASIVCTMHGYGPINLIHGSLSEKTLVLQGFLATAALISLPIASALTYRTQLESSLREARNIADKANIAKSQFLTSMSHELRTPLNAILGFSQLLLMDKDLKPRNREHLEMVLAGGEHLMKLIGDVLDLAKIEAGKVSIELEAVDCSELSEELTELLRPMANRNKISIEVEKEKDLFVTADRGRLIQVMVNLLSNAIKYNVENGKVVLAISELPQSVRIEVRDTGRGISASRQQDAFQPFNRLGAEQSKIEGTGIGLAISKQLVEAMKGRIGFSSKEGEGSVFYIELPKTVSQKSDTSKDVREMAAPDKSRSRILYIEDNLANAELMKAVVADFLNAELLIVQDGASGIREAHDFAPDVIISDIHLSDMTGYDVLTNLRADPKTSGIPVFALTADATFPQARQAEGFDRVMTKPFQLNELVENIGNALKAA